MLKPKNRVCFGGGGVTSKPRLAKGNAFTLAEVLITITIIGVVAAVTLPLLIQNYQKKVTVEQLKKSFSNFSNVINMSVNDNGSLDEWDYSLSNVDFAEKYILPYLNNAKHVTYNPKRQVKALGVDGRALTYDNPSKTAEYSLPDGSYFVVSPSVDNNQPYLTIGVDINGEKGPNQNARDVFYFAIPRASVKKFTTYPAGNNDVNCKINGVAASYGRYNGRGCSDFISKNGWKITADYPW